MVVGVFGNAVKEGVHERNDSPDRDRSYHWWIRR